MVYTNITGKQECLSGTISAQIDFFVFRAYLYSGNMLWCTILWLRILNRLNVCESADFAQKLVSINKENKTSWKETDVTVYLILVPEWRNHIITTCRNVKILFKKSQNNSHFYIFIKFYNQKPFFYLTE